MSELAQVIRAKALQLFTRLQGYPEDTPTKAVERIFNAQSAISRDRWDKLAAEVLDTEIKALERAAILCDATAMSPADVLYYENGCKACAEQIRARADKLRPHEEEPKTAA